MKTIEIENKSGKVKLNEVVTRDSIGRMIDEIGKLFGASAVSNGADFGEIQNVAENAVDVLEIEINSPGGSVFDGYTIYQEIKSLQDRGVVVNCTITGLAASMASVIAMSCDKIKIVPHGRMMIHDASNVVQGNAEQLRQSADLLDSISEDIASIYSNKTGISQDNIRSLMKKETWMNADECLSNGFADEIFDIRKSNGKKESMNLFKNFIQALSPDEKIQFAAQVAEVESLSNELVEANAKIEELANLSALALEKEVKIQDLSEQNDKLANDIKSAQEEIENLKNSIAEKEVELVVVEASVGEQTIEALAAIGQPAALEIQEDEAPTKDLILAQFSKMKAGEERTAFFKKHKSILSIKS